jgi:hypothetical protein
MNTQANLVRLASTGEKIPVLNFDEIVHKRRAEDINFKSSLFESLNILMEKNILYEISVDRRFAFANLFHWLRKYQASSSLPAEEVIHQIAPYYTDRTIDSNRNITDFVHLFQPTNEDESFAINVFPELKEHLSIYDLVDFIRGLDRFFNLVIQKHFDEHSNFNLIQLSEFISSFREKIKKEVKSKGEMSFMFDDSAQVQLSFGEIYNIFLGTMFQIYFSDLSISANLETTLIMRLLKETEMSYVGALAEAFYNELKREPIRKKIDSGISAVESAQEDDIDDLMDELKSYLISIVDRLDLNFLIGFYDNYHDLSGLLSVKPIIDEQLLINKKEPHFTIYSINRLLEFKKKHLFSKPELIVYIREMSETVALLKTEKFQVPDEELRFFIDRMLQNMNSWANFSELSRKFRNNLITTERNQLLHSMLQESSLNNRHASALLSFYYAAKIETQYSNKLSLINIEEIANRLGSTFSITRRFKIAKFIEQSLNEGKLKDQPLETLQQKGFFSLIANKVINDKELEYTFEQYIDVANYFDEEYDELKNRANYIRQIVKDIISYINERIRKEFAEVINELDSDKSIREILRFAETKVITLLTRELDSFHRDNTVDTINREMLVSHINQYAEDANAQYMAERETQNINIADLYMKIQNYSMKVTVVLGEIRKSYNEEIEKIRSQENFDDVERIQLIMGGIAVAKRDDQLNFEQKGLINILDDIRKNTENYASMIKDIISDTSIRIELKDEMGKTRHIHHKHFAKTNAIILSTNAKSLCTMFEGVILGDLLKEVADALVSARNMAKNVQELKVTLDDIFKRSKDLFGFAEDQYNKIMGNV